MIPPAYSLWGFPIQEDTGSFLLIVRTPDIVTFEMVPRGRARQAVPLRGVPSLNVVGDTRMFQQIAGFVNGPFGFPGIKTKGLKAPGLNSQGRR